MSRSRTRLAANQQLQVPQSVQHVIFPFLWLSTTYNPGINVDLSPRLSVKTKCPCHGDRCRGQSVSVIKTKWGVDFGDTVVVDSRCCQDILLNITYSHTWSNLGLPS